MAKAEPQVSEDGLVYTFKLREAKMDKRGSS